MAHLPILPVVWPLAAAFFLALLAAHNVGGLRRMAAGCAAVQLLLCTVLFRLVGEQGPQTYHLGGWSPPFGIAVRADLLSTVMLMLVAGISLAVMVYAADPGDHDLSPSAQRWFVVLALILLGSMSGMVLSRDLFNLIVMIEITSIAAYGIVSIRDHPAALEASLKYLMLGAMGSGALLMATALVYATTGYLDMSLAGQQMITAAARYPQATMAALAMFLVGFGLKAGLMPFHSWLPDAHGSAATTSSALLSGLVVKVNAIGFLKVAYSVWGAALLARTPLPQVLMVFAILSMLVGGALAWGQTDLKRLLAYSTVGHMGYVFLGAALGSTNAFAGSLLHIVNHAVLKACLFLAAGLLTAKAGTRDIAKLSGIGRAMPWTAAAFGVAALGMVGVPGTNGFVSKWYIALGALDLGRAVPALAVLVSSLLNGVFYLPIVINAFLRPGPYERTPGGEAGLAALLPVVILAGVVVLMGLWPGLTLRYLLDAARTLLPAL